MGKNINILFTSAGRRVSLLKIFKKELGVAGVIVASDLKKNAPALYVADHMELTPRITDKEYIPRLLEICKKYDIKLLIPLIDTELLLLSYHRSEFANIGVTLLVSSVETNLIAADKLRTAEFFKNNGFLTPSILDVQDLITDNNMQFPYFLKPVNGSASEQIHKINNLNELKFFANYVPHAILQEYVAGTEYTLDILLDFNGKVRCVVPRQRIEVRSGEVSKGITVKNAEIIKYGKKVAEALPGAIGCITVQCFVTEAQEVKFIEINPRFGGGYPLSYHAGANYPKWIIEMMQGVESNIIMDGWKDRMIMLRFDDAIYIENWENNV